MEDAALNAARARMAQIEQEISKQKNIAADANAQISKLQVEYADVEGFIEAWHKFAGIQFVPTAAERNQIALPVSGKPKRIRPHNPDREFVVEKSLEIIRGRGRPISRRALFEELTKRDVNIHGKNPEMVLSTMLWRSQDKIVRLPTYGYWDASQSYPEADYVSNVFD